MRPTARAVTLLVCLFLPAAAAAQDPPLRLDGLSGGGVRPSATEAWGTFDLTLTNASDRDRLARVLFFYEGHEDLQFGRDVWVPARSTVNSWLLAGPVPSRAKGSEFGRSTRMLLYDRTDGTDVWVRPKTEERFRAGAVTYRKRDPRNPYAAVILDPHVYGGDGFGRVPQPPGYNDEVNDLIRTLRATIQLPTVAAGVVRTGPLPALPEAFDGVDHLIVASNRVADDAAGLRAIRQWLMRGGTAWVLLDRVDPESVAPLLGDTLDFQLVGRVSLTAFRFEAGQGRRSDDPPQEHERPVGFARVLLPDGEDPRYTIEGWPLWFNRSVGRGKVVFTTLGPRGWTRTPGRKEKPPFPGHPTVPAPLTPLVVLASQFQPVPEDDPFRPEPLVAAFRRPLSDEIGYSVPSLGAVAAVFGGFLAGSLAMILALRASGRRERMGFVAPALALIAAAAFVALGERARRAAAPAVAAGQVVDFAPGVEEASVRGVIAAYRPEGGPADLGAGRGGLFEIDLAGTSGQTRRFVAEDLGKWHWEGLSLPAGVRLATFRYTADASEAGRAVARFGAEGLEGKLSAGGARNVSDAVLVTVEGGTLAQGERQGPRLLAVQAEPDGSFRCGSEDALPEGRFLAGTLLSDRQQRRQELYRRFLEKAPGSLRGRTVLLAWSDPFETHFRLRPGAREAGDALLVLPLEYRPAEANARVTVPGPLVPYRRLKDGVPTRAASEGGDGIEQHLRFQLPGSALPLQVERVRVRARIDAPSRQVVVSAREGERFTEVYRADASPDPLRAEVVRPELLSLDPEGGLHLSVRITDPPREKGKGSVRAVSETRWKIHYLELEVVGRMK